ncbi:MAG: N-acetylmuramoyl-L-alanine amidase [Lachnospiraceae bacterium]|nr:N-acetylmuramoyl-L-alanine amidase [Lachnospiraceae bacterium]
MATIVIDAGHGGSDPGAVFEGRQEKDDTLRLALAVGKILEENGQNVIYTRTTDVYQTPFQKATIANEAGADFFVSIHRNSSPVAGQYSGVETLVYERSGIKEEMAENINRELEEAGFKNLGVKERPGLVVLRRTKMPAVLVEAGFINSGEDNRIFDENFEEVAQAIADGILRTLYAQEVESYAYKEENTMPYRIQVGYFTMEENAKAMQMQLALMGYQAETETYDGAYRVVMGNFENLDNAAKMEQVLRKNNFNTYIVTQ